MSQKKRTFINSDEELIVKGSLIVQGEFIQKETTVVQSETVFQGDTLVINANGTEGPGGDPSSATLEFRTQVDGNPVTRSITLDPSNPDVLVFSHPAEIPGTLQIDDIVIFNEISIDDLTKINVDDGPDFEFKTDSGKIEFTGTAASTRKLEDPITIGVSGDMTGTVNIQNSGSTKNLAVTLNTVNTDTGTWGQANLIPVFTVNGKGLITDAQNVPVDITASQINDFTDAIDTYLSGNNGVVYNAQTGVIEANVDVLRTFHVNDPVGEGENGLTYVTGNLSVDATVVRTLGDQTIDGEKTFQANTTFESSVTFESTVEVQNELTVQSNVLLPNDTAFIPATDSTVDLGTSANHLGNVFTNTAHIRDLNLGTGGIQEVRDQLSGQDGINYDNTTGEFEVDNTVVRTLGDQTIDGEKTFQADAIFEANVQVQSQAEFQDNVTFQSDVTLDDNLLFSNDTAIIPTTDSTVDLGTSANHLGNVFTNTATIRNVNLGQDAQQTIRELLSGQDGINFDNTTGEFEVDDTVLRTSHVNDPVGEGDNGLTYVTGNLSVDATVVRTFSDQTIDGEKTYQADATFESNVEVQGELTVQSNVLITNDISIVPATDSTVDLGTPDNFLGNLYVDTAELRKVELGSNAAQTIRELLSGQDGINFDNTTGEFEVDNTVVRTLGDQTIDGEKTFQADITFESNVDIQGELTVQSDVLLPNDIAFIPATGNTVDLGTTASFLGNLYVDSAVIRDLELGSGGIQEVRDQLSGQDGINYDNITGEFEVDDTVLRVDWINDPADNGLTYSTGNISVDETVIRTGSSEVPLNQTIYGSLNVVGNLNSITQIDLYLEDNKIILNKGMAATDAHIKVSSDQVQIIDANGDVIDGTWEQLPGLRWKENIQEWQFSNDGETYYPLQTYPILQGGNAIELTANGVINAQAGSGITVTSSAIELTPSGVTAGDYGQADQLVAFSVDQFGRITTSSNVTIDITASQVNDFTDAIDSYLSGNNGVVYNNQTGVIEADIDVVRTFGVQSISGEKTIQDDITIESAVLLPNDTAFIPATDSTVDLGTSAKHLGNVFTDTATVRNISLGGNAAQTIRELLSGQDGINYDNTTGEFEVDSTVLREQWVSDGLDIDTETGNLSVDISVLRTQWVNDGLDIDTETGNLSVDISVVRTQWIDDGLDIDTETGNLSVDDSVLRVNWITDHIDNGLIYNLGNISVDSTVLREQWVSDGLDIDTLTGNLSVDSSVVRSQWVSDGLDIDTATGDLRVDSTVLREQWVSDGLDIDTLTGNLSVDNTVLRTQWVADGLDIDAQAGILNVDDTVLRTQWVNDNTDNGLTYTLGNIAVDATVVRTSGDQSIAGGKQFTGRVVLPDNDNGAQVDGQIFYRNEGTNIGFFGYIDGQAIPLTPVEDTGTVITAKDAFGTGIEIFAGKEEVELVTGTSLFESSIKTIDAGTNLLISETSNVITISANVQAIRGDFSASTVGSFGSLVYNNSTGLFTYTTPTTAQIRQQISATGLVSYNSTTGVISTDADQYTSWSVQTETGAGGKQAIGSGQTLEILGGTNITVTNTGNVITIQNDNLADITGVVAGDGLVGGGDQGNVTLEVGAGNGITVNSANIEIDYSAFSGGTGVTYDGLGQFSLGQDVDPGATVNFVRVTGLSLPEAPSDAVNKEYTDNLAVGLQARTRADVLVDFNLVATYNNGTDGVGATLTATSNTAFPSVDGVDSEDLNVVTTRFLVIGQDIAAHNGLYVLDQIGDSGQPWILRRCVECDEAFEIPGSFVFIRTGDTYGGTGWTAVVDDPLTFVVGTDAINWNQFSGVGTFTAGAGLDLDGTEFSVVLGTGLNFDGNAVRLNPAVAGNGLVHNAGVVSVGAGTGITVNASNVALSSTAVTPGTYGNASTSANFTVDQFGRLTNAGENAINITSSQVSNFTSSARAAISVSTTGPGSLSYDNSTGVISYIGISQTEANVLIDNRVSGGAGLTYTSGELAVGAGTGITVNDSNVALTASGVTAGSYGAANVVSTFTVDDFGRLTTAGTTSINIAASQIGSGTIDYARLPEIRFADISANAYLTSSQTFSNSNSLLMTAAAINTRIQSFGYGTIQTVTGGNGLTGTGSSGTVTLDVGAGTGITVNPSNVAVDATVVRTSGTQTIDGSKTFSTTITGSISGNAGTATTLQNARNINGTSFDGSQNITTANWGTARTITIGSTGKSVNGSGNVSWSLAEIGVNDSTLTLATSGIATGSQTWTSNQGSAATFTVNVPGTNLALTGSGDSRTITSSTGDNVVIPVATITNAGFMSIDDKSKLDGVATGATANTGTVTSVSGGDGLTGNVTTSGSLAVDSTVIRTTGNQTLGGTKTFTDAVVLSTAGTTTSHAVRADRSISTSGIATGGGNLTANRTINVPGTDLGSSGTGGTRTITSSTGGNTSITYTAADVGAPPTSLTITAGNGLTGGGNLTADRTITLGTPETITTTSTNSVSTSGHSHELTLPASATRGEISTTNITNTTSSTLGFISGRRMNDALTNYGDPFSTSGTYNSLQAGQVQNSLTPGNFITGSAFNGSTAITWNINATSANTANAIVARDGSGNFSANIMTGTATQARYADLAERYAIDQPAQPGTVVVFGGDQEITQSTTANDHRVVGVVSTDPAYLMNCDAGDDQTHPAIALTGRVPVRVTGVVNPGDLMVTSDIPGHAQADNHAQPGRIIGKAIGKNAGGEGIIEVLITLM